MHKKVQSLLITGVLSANMVGSTVAVFADDIKKENDVKVEDAVKPEAEKIEWQKTNEGNLDELWNYDEEINQIVLNEYKGAKEKNIEDKKKNVEIPREIKGKKVVLKDLKTNVFPNVERIRVAEGTDTDKVKVINDNLKDAFDGNKSIKSLDLRGIDVSNVINLVGFLSDASKLEEVDLSGWDVSKVKDLSYFFTDDKNLKKAKLSEWNVSNVEAMTSLFYNASTLKTVDISGWKPSKKLTNTVNMFGQCSSLESIDLSTLNMDNVENAEYMFKDCSSLSKIKGTENWTLRSIKNMQAMFKGTKLNFIDLRKCDLPENLTKEGMNIVFADSKVDNLIIVTDDKNLKGYDYIQDGRTHFDLEFNTDGGTFNKESQPQTIDEFTITTKKAELLSAPIKDGHKFKRWEMQNDNKTLKAIWDKVEQENQGNGNVPGGSGSVSPNPEGSGSENPNPGGSGSENPNPGGSGSVSPNPEGSGSVSPNPGGSGSVSPNPGGSGSENPNPGGPGNENPNPGGSGSENPNPGGSGSVSPNPGGSGSENPNPGGSGSVSPNPGGSGSVSPNPGGSGSVSPNPGGSGSENPNPGGSGSVSPNPGGSGSVSPNPGGSGSENPNPGGGTGNDNTTVVPPQKLPSVYELIDENMVTVTQMGDGTENNPLILQVKDSIYKVDLTHFITKFDTLNSNVSTIKRNDTYTEYSITVDNKNATSSIKKTAPVINDKITFVKLRINNTKIDLIKEANRYSRRRNYDIKIPIIVKFSDVKDNFWGRSYIEDFASMGIVDGYPNNEFKPNNSITRAEFVRIINNAFGYTKTIDNVKFNDVEKNSWYYNDIAIALKQGYINGRSETTFSPNDNITREEVAMMLTNIMNNKDNDFNRLNSFNDGNKTSDWAKSAMAGAIKAGYLIGDDQKNLSPTKNMTRAEAIASLSRVRPVK